MKTTFGANSKTVESYGETFKEDLSVELDAWECDGGSCGGFDDVTLFDGRLYTDRRSLRVAQLQYYSKDLATVAATLLPVIAFLNVRPGA